jgi:hypothetical protein
MVTSMLRFHGRCAVGQRAGGDGVDSGSGCGERWRARARQVKVVIAIAAMPTRAAVV